MSMIVLYLFGVTFNILLFHQRIIHSLPFNSRAWLMAGLNFGLNFSIYFHQRTLTLSHSLTHCIYVSSFQLHSSHSCSFFTFAVSPIIIMYLNVSFDNIGCRKLLCKFLYFALRYFLSRDQFLSCVFVVY